MKIKSGYGVENLNLTMSLEEIIQIWGEAEEIASYDNQSDYYVWYQKGFCCCFTIELKLLSIFFYSGVHGGFFETDIFPYLAFDSNLDFSEQEVRDIYGVPNAEGKINFADIPYIWLSYQGIGFDIVMETKKTYCIAVFRNEE